ncbi:MAG: hypothetical protein AAGC76_13905 [Luteibacter sp.]|uniref:hypothetical protein n=1 Tax=Luteibacter sp. TaxID=1886636 RepID=UPI0028077ED8|nr:hypothetical protein [Luteibacter sp.]MDQ7996928.1 hypothetical protein [Luteibacter sp.]MDQ8049300.1 hypothetical protein [Luteibacter sp.]
MKVKDLIAHLTTFDPNLEVMCAAEDKELVGAGELVRFLDIQETISVVEGRTGRDDSGSFTFHSAAAREHARSLSLT